MADESDKPKREFSQAMLDGQRAFTLKAKRKAGKDIAPEDASWLDAWIAAHPPKAPKAKAAPVDGATPDAGAASPRAVEVEAPEPDYPDPVGKPEGIRVLVDDKPKKGAAAPKARWQDKWQMSMEVELPGGKKVSLKGDSGRELLCIQGAGMILGVYSLLTDALELVGKKPLVPEEMMFGPAVLMLDQHMPQNLVPKPEHVVAFGFCSAAVSYGLNYKAIREAKKTKTARDEHKAKVEELRQRTAQREAEYQESERAKTVASEHVAQPAPVAQPTQDPARGIVDMTTPRSVPDTTVERADPRDSDVPLLAHDPSAGYREKPPGWNIHAPVDLPDDVVI